MTPLAQWQHDLAAAIDGGTTIDVALAARSVPGLSAEQACEVYRRSSQGARVAALSDVYPVCRQLLGRQSFDGLARKFVRRNSSTQPDLNRFGDGFSAFVDTVVDTQKVFAGLPWLGELVALEWACHSIYYADDDPPLDLGPLADAEPSQLFLRPISALVWLRTTWPVHAIRAAHRDGDDPSALRIEPGEWCLVIERRGYEAWVEVVDTELWRLLDSCAQGWDLARLAADDSLATERLGELIERGWMGAVERRNDVV
ncbi:MAG: putative DNA-binding domain-containing protein [Chromatiales bacterium]|nr:putative DNA-binding domain-containing protein [Chromatiales bacterium]